MEKALNRSKIKTAAVAAAAIALAGTVGVWAAFTAQGSAEATTTTGKVGIELSRVEPEPDRLLVTGSVVACDSTVTNTGAEGWVRCKIDYEVDGGIMGRAAWEGGEAVSGEGWVLASDGWWYATEPLGEGETIPFESTIQFPVFEQVKIDGEWVWAPVTGELDQSKWKVPSPDEGDDESLMTYCGAEGSVLSEQVTAHVIQRKNFEPDFTADHPWGDAEIEGAYASSSKEGK